VTYVHAEDVQVHGHCIVKMFLTVTTTVPAEPEGLTLLIPEPAIGHEPEPVPSASHPHNICLYKNSVATGCCNLQKFHIHYVDIKGMWESSY
jgi:hypothetical protein